jgi:aldose 1-epimerase
MDFREPWALAEGLDSAFPALRAAGGYDHNYCVGERAGELRRVARLVGDASHIAMDVETDLPGLQLYTANQLKECVGKDGATYGRHQAVCLETQYWPDAVNHADWDQPVFGPDRPYHSVTAYRFGLA